MSKYRKDKKLPEGISQRKSGKKLAAGFVDKTGKRHQRQFDTMVKADRYVHVTDDSMEMGIRLFEQGQLEKGLATA